ncbi:MAG: GNAT family N-acyltransferase [Polyangiaceae bacterium]
MNDLHHRSATSSAEPNESRSCSPLRVGFATSVAEREAVFRLRYDVFTKLGTHVGEGTKGRDCDEFDDDCHHAAVWKDGTLVATCRILPAEGASRVGRYFSSTEFDLSELLRRHTDILEVGRVCVHPDFRASVAIVLLWKSIAELVVRTKAQYLTGCATLFEKSPDRVAAIMELLRERGVVEDLGVSPICRIAKPTSLQNDTNVTWNDLPGLLRSYIQMGGRVLGEPCYDPIFDSAEVLIWVPLASLPKRFSNHLMRDFSERTCQA